MIDERMEEKAALHVLGALTPEEAREFKAAMRQDSELKEFVKWLRPKSIIPSVNSDGGGPKMQKMVNLLRS